MSIDLPLPRRRERAGERGLGSTRVAVITLTPMRFARGSERELSGDMNSIGPRTLETDVTFCPLPNPLPQAGEGAQDRLTISAAHL